MPELDERVAVLEADKKHTDKKIDEMSAKLDEMHEIFMKAKGAQWVIFTAAAVGGFLAGKVGFLLSFFGTK